MTTQTLDAPHDGPLHQLARSAWQSLLLLGIFSATLGALVLAWPGKTLVVAGILFGLYLILSGIGQVFAAFGTHSGAGLRILAFISGIISLMLGFFCFRDKLESILLLALWIGIGWLFRGTALLITTLSDRAMPARGWQALTGLLVTLGGGALIIYPFDSIAALTLAVGSLLIAIGLLEIIDAFQLRRRIGQLTDH